jgi:hypothetical protein
MVAIITDKFKRQILDDLFTDVTDSAETYYIAIGRSQDWNSTDVAPTPLNTAKAVRDFRVNMQAMKKGEDVSYVVPRYNWSSGTIYSGYDDNVQGYPSNAYYVMTDELSVYVCLQQGRDTSGNAYTFCELSARINSNCIIRIINWVRNNLTNAWVWFII